MEKRKQQRTKRRMTCELVIGSHRFHAIVRDISSAGLFLQTRVKLEPSTVVEVFFSAYDGQPEVRVKARVARTRIAPPRLQSDVPGGVGLELMDVPPAFQELLARRVDAAVGGREPDQKIDGQSDRVIRTYRIRLTQRGKWNSRVLSVRAESAQGARARALAQAGRDWKIADIQEI
jgi:hypothetical protein